ncbi:MAG: hypothetical protein U0992_09600 [Planctomycetaceae bacterium]
MSLNSALIDQIVRDVLNQLAGGAAPMRTPQRRALPAMQRRRSKSRIE